jgi:hypothetical protein
LCIPSLKRGIGRRGGESVEAHEGTLGMTETSKRRKPNWNQFTALMAKTGNVRTACTIAGIWPSAAYRRRKTVKWFATSWDRALQEYEIRKNFRGPKPRNYKRSMDPPSKAAFLTCLRNTRNVSLSARYARVARSVAYGTREIDRDFCRAWEEIMEATSPHRAKTNIKARYPNLCRSLKRCGDVAKAAKAVGFDLSFAEELVKRDPKCALANAQGTALRRKGRDCSSQHVAS